MCALLRHCFWKEREAFLDDLRPKYILSSLISYELISDDEKDDILSKGINKHQVKRLFEVLAEKGSSAFDLLVKALEYDDCYPWLAQRLKECRNDNSQGDSYNVTDELYNKLVIGGVPFQTNYLLNRPEELHKIRNALKETSIKRRGWTVLHGMVGCGKSVLAAEAVRDADIFKCFTEGICWIAVGKLKGNNNLLYKMQLLIEKLNPAGLSPPFITEAEIALPQTLEKTTTYLKAVVAPKENRILVILDDVWRSDVITAFDIGCPIMVTTRDRGVVECVCSYSSLIEIQPGLKSDEAKKFLAKWVNSSEQDLPEDIDSIFNKCKGSPMVLSLIGGMMAKHGNKPERWKYLSDKLLKGQLEAVRQRRGSGNQQTNLKEAVKLSIDSLDEHIRHYYQDFAVFENDVYIPNKVLETLWKVDKFEVEDIMYELAKKCLARMEENADENSWVYSIHDLYLEILKEECSSVKDLHIKLVKNYMDLCKCEENKDPDYKQLPDDGYICTYLAYHLYEAEDDKLFSGIFTDLNFMQRKIQITGISDLLNDYDVYGDYIFKAVKEKEDFQNFIKKNAHLLREENIDIVQLALYEPFSSIVHQQAQTLATSQKDQIYWEWCNQSDIPPVLTTRLSIIEIRSTTFSPDSSIIASIGESEKVILWDSSSGKELKSLSGHTDYINCCTFSSDGSRLATASKDKTVKFWNIDFQYLQKRILSRDRNRKHSLTNELDNLKLDELNDSSIFTFKQHQDEVLCCSFSTDDSLMISSDCIGIALIWECKTGNVKQVLQHNVNPSSAYPVNCCCFSYDAKMVATASDSTITLWNSSSGDCNAMLHHNDQMISKFCFTEQFLLSAAGSFIWRWDLSTYKYKQYNSIKHSCTLSSCCVTPDAIYVAAGTSEHSVVIWNLKSETVVADLRTHSSPVQSVAYSNDGSKLLSASSDGVVIIWDTNRSIGSSFVKLANNLSVQFSEEITIATSDQFNCIQVLTGASGTLKHKSPPDEDDITTCSLSNDCSEVVYGTKKGHVKVFNLCSGNILPYSSHASQVTYLIHLKNSDSFITCSEDTTLRVWKSGSEFTQLKGHTQTVVMCVVLNSSKKLLSCSEDCTLRVWDMNDEKCILILKGHSNSVTFCDVSSDEKFLASASLDCTVMLWDSTYGYLLRKLQCKDCVRCCHFSPLPGILFSGDDSGCVMKWNVEDRHDHGKFFGKHDSLVKNIKFSSDGQQLVTVADNIKCWNSSGSLAQTLQLHGGYKCPICVCPIFNTMVIIDNSVLYILKRVL